MSDGYLSCLSPLWPKDKNPCQKSGTSGKEHSFAKYIKNIKYFKPGNEIMYENMEISGFKYIIKLENISKFFTF